MKIIPPFKPIASSATESPGSSPEKNNQKHGTGNEASGSNQTHLPGASSAGENSGSGTTNAANPNISPDINSSSKNSKPSLKKSSVSNNNNGKSGSNNNSNSGNSSTNSSTNPSPIPKIQPSNLFSSGAFSTSLGMSRHPSGEKPKGKSEEDANSGKTAGSVEDSHSHRSGNGKFTMKTKDYTTLSMSDVVTAALDRPMASKFDLSNSASLPGGIEPPASQLTSSGHHHHHRHDKPPPDIKPHVTLTPIPMRSSDEAKMGARSSKSPALTFPSSFGQASKFSAHQTSPELSDREKKSKTDADLPLEALTPTKRSR